MKEVGIIPEPKPEKPFSSCCNDIPPMPPSECGPEIPRRKSMAELIQDKREEQDQKLLEQKNGTVLKMGPNRKQRRRSAKTKRAGMMRGNNFTPAKKKRK